MGVKSGIAALVGISLIGLGSYLLAKSVTARKQSPS